MPFPRARNRTPAALGAIIVKLIDLPSAPQQGTFPAPAFTFEIVLLDADGEQTDSVRGDLEPHLTPGQVTALTNFMATIRAKAVEVLT
jgi:hypothetical protein